MNRFLQNSGSRKFKTFDEHISYLTRQIIDNKDCIRDCKEEIEEWQKEIEEIKAAKEAAEKNPTETHEPSVYLNGWKDTESKKQEVYEWCQAHEIKHHPEVVGNFYKELRMAPEHHNPSYEFITATSDTNKIRYVRCIECYKKWIREGKENQETDTFERYLKD